MPTTIINIIPAPPNTFANRSSEFETTRGGRKGTIWTHHFDRVHALALLSDKDGQYIVPVVLTEFWKPTDLNEGATDLWTIGEGCSWEDDNGGCDRDLVPHNHREFIADQQPVVEEAVAV